MICLLYKNKIHDLLWLLILPYMNPPTAAISITNIGEKPNGTINRQHTIGIHAVGSVI